MSTRYAWAVSWPRGCAAVVTRQSSPSSAACRPWPQWPSHRIGVPSIGGTRGERERRSFVSYPRCKLLKETVPYSKVSLKNDGRVRVAGHVVRQLTSQTPLYSSSSPLPISSGSRYKIPKISPYSFSSAVRAPIIKVWSNRHHTRRLNSASLYCIYNRPPSSAEVLTPHLSCSSPAPIAER